MQHSVSWSRCPFHACFTRFTERCWPLEFGTFLCSRIRVLLRHGYLGQVSVTWIRNCSFWDVDSWWTFICGKDALESVSPCQHSLQWGYQSIGLTSSFLSLSSLPTSVYRVARPLLTPCKARRAMSEPIGSVQWIRMTLASLIVGLVLLCPNHQLRCLCQRPLVRRHLELR